MDAGVVVLRNNPLTKLFVCNMRVSSCLGARRFLLGQYVILA